MAKEALDLYPNIIADSLTMSAANTMTFDEINVGLNIFDKVALLIQRLEVYFAGGTLGDLDTDLDAVFFAITSRNDLLSLAPQQPEVIDVIGLQVDVLGAVVSKMVYPIPMVHDFSTLRGGGLLVAPRPLYAAGHSTGMTIAGLMYWRMYMNIIKLETDQYLELLETRRAFGG